MEKIIRPYHKNGGGKPKTPLTIQQMQTLVLNSSTFITKDSNLKAGLKSFVNLILQKIKEKELTGDKKPMSLDKNEMKTLFNSYGSNSTTASKERALRELLTNSHVITRAPSKTKYRDKRKNYQMLSQSDFLICYQTKEQKDKINKLINVYGDNNTEPNGKQTLL
jgi:hypothetical protein